ncbi:hypothetical protein JTB14_037717 [Gonioctena quinquepunctata]|nr:hypothetical protein JTB14_037717 [Gonioctena quinquepunctata]
MYRILTLFMVVATVSADFSSRFQNGYEGAASGPYPPAGWRPSGPEFRLPTPHASYGPPQEYLPPPSQGYGTPTSEEPTTTEAEKSTTEQPTTTEYATEVTTESESANSLDGEKQNQKLTQSIEQEGVYFIYHPGGQLQRVVYTTNDDQIKMAYSASFKYENVEPISGPVYTYDPNTFIFQQLNR